ncbi:hypothetical protein AAKU67_002019 [Oxalobacteraceae bacterium GrIS 2.11]
MIGNYKASQPLNLLASDIQGQHSDSMEIEIADPVPTPPSLQFLCCRLQTIGGYSMVTGVLLMTAAFLAAVAHENSRSGVERATDTNGSSNATLGLAISGGAAILSGAICLCLSPRNTR